MKHLITGAGGFLGTHLIAALRTRFPQDTIVSMGLHAPHDPQVRHFETDLSDAAAVRTVLKAQSPDRLYHLAGSARVSQEIGFPQYFQSNSQTTQVLADALETLDPKPLRLFFSSSVHVYGNQDSEVDESVEPRPNNDYGMSKYLGERALEAFAGRSPHAKVVVGRLYSCIGPGQGPGFVTSDLARKLAALPVGGTLETGPLDAYRRFLDVRDAAALLARLLETGADTGFEIVNIASPNELQVRAIVERLVTASGKKASIHASPSDQNPFRGLKVNLAKLQQRIPGFPFSPLDKTLQDIWKDQECKTKT
ncbi:NAD-dependent epimerase/dehydratase family protein [bacterium]|nr:NAD-dependent epimerase/dehydratase family protein [bacterium]